jgi:hypothetical protein
VPHNRPMGYGIMAYAVDLAVVRAVIGSGDEDLAEEVGEYFEAEFDDDYLAELAGGPGTPTAMEVARHMVMGEPYDDTAGFAYGYLFKQLCERHGSFLPNDAWYPCGSRFIARVDEALAAAGVPEQTLTVDALAFGGAPVPLPPTDFPGIGWLERSYLDGALEAIAVDRLGELADVDIRTSIDQLRGWLEHCRRDNRDLVCFYH